MKLHYIQPSLQIEGLRSATHLRVEYVTDKKPLMRKNNIGLKNDYIQNGSSKHSGNSAFSLHIRYDFLISISLISVCSFLSSDSNFFCSSVSFFISCTCFSFSNLIFSNSKSSITSLFVFLFFFLFSTGRLTVLKDQLNQNYINCFL